MAIVYTSVKALGQVTRLHNCLCILIDHRLWISRYHKTVSSISEKWHLIYRLPFFFFKIVHVFITYICKYSENEITVIDALHLSTLWPKVSNDSFVCFLSHRGLQTDVQGQEPRPCYETRPISSLIHTYVTARLPLAGSLRTTASCRTRNPRLPTANLREGINCMCVFGGVMGVCLPACLSV